MAEVNWTKFALENVSNIADLISKDSVSYAEFFVRKIFEKVIILEEFPNSGRIVPEFENVEIRELIFGNYRIVYKLFDEKIDVLTVHHSARLLSNSPLFEN